MDEGSGGNDFLEYNAGVAGGRGGPDQGHVTVRRGGANVLHRREIRRHDPPR